MVNRTQGKGGGEPDDYGSPLEELGNKKTEICCSHLVRKVFRAVKIM